MSFFDMTALRAILDTETDTDSPLSEELMSQMRENLEALLILLAGTNITGSATSNPPNDTTGWLTDTASAWTDDLHNGRTLLMTSGLAIGNMYTIDDTVASTDRLVCTGDNLYSDGVRSGNTYLILYDVKANLTGHDHDGINSPNVTLADNSLAKGKIKSVANTTGVSGSIGVTASVSIAMQDYCFTPNIYVDNQQYIRITGHNTSTADTTARLGLRNDEGSSNSYNIRYRYITASDNPFIYAIQDKITGEIKHLWACDDPPPGYWGLSEKPSGFIAPIVESSLVMATMEEIVLFNQNREFVIELGEKANVDKKLPFEILSKGYDYDINKKWFSSKNLKEI